MKISWLSLLSCLFIIMPETKQKGEERERQASIALLKKHGRALLLVTENTPASVTI